MGLSSVEMCAGAGGQALGLEQAGFRHEALVEIERPFCDTLRLNRPRWNVCEGDLSDFDGRPYLGIDLLAVCPVRRSRSRESNSASTTSGICFLRPCALSMKSARAQS
jgi:hypothetical protein